MVKEIRLIFQIKANAKGFQMRYCLSLYYKHSHFYSLLKLVEGREKIALITLPFFIVLCALLSFGISFPVTFSGTSTSSSQGYKNGCVCSTETNDTSSESPLHQL